MHLEAEWRKGREQMGSYQFQSTPGGPKCTATYGIHVGTWLERSRLAVSQVRSRLALSQVVKFLYLWAHNNGNLDR